MNIKVSGITSVKQLLQLDGLNIAFAGLDFRKDSLSYAGNKFKPTEIALADPDVKTIGIFANAGYDEITDISEKFSLDIIELSGDETPQLCEQLSEDLEVIMTYRMGNEEMRPEEFMEDYDEVCDYYLFKKNDMPSAKFDWKILSGYKIEKPFFISGGIGPGDAAALKKFKHPDFFGADINSRFEKEPGIKDMALLLKFLQGLK